MLLLPLPPLLILLRLQRDTLCRMPTTPPRYLRDVASAKITPLRAPLCRRRRPFITDTPRLLNRE